MEQTHMHIDEEKEIYGHLYGDYMTRGWLRITDATTKFQPHSVDEAEWSTYFVFLNPTDKIASAVCRARSDEAARDFAFSSDGANLPRCTIWKYTARLLGPYDNIMGRDENGHMHIDIRDFEDDLDTMVYIGYIIDRISSEGYEYTYDECEEMRTVVRKAVDEAGLPGILDNWYA